MNEDEQPSRKLFVDVLGMDDHSAALLADAGLTTIEELAYVPLAELVEIEGLNKASITRLRELARQYLDGDPLG